MQLTRFDRWLREKYVYETHIHTLRPPEFLPDGVKAVETPDIPGNRYKHLFVARCSDDADRLIGLLKENSQMYTTKIVDREHWLVPFIAPKDKSVTWSLFSAAIISVCVAAAFWYIKGLADDPEIRKNVAEAFELLKG